MNTPPGDGGPPGVPGTPGTPGTPRAPSTPSPADSPQLERHQVRVGSLEPVSPSLARRPDGTPLRAERSPTPTGAAPRGPRTTPPSPSPSPSPSVTEFAGVPRWARRAEVWAPGAPGSARGDPQHKKSSQFDEHIHQMRDEQERVQKKTFLNWINSHLRHHDPPMQITNLIDDLKDSTRLLALLNVLSGQDLPVERGRRLRTPHFLSNANTALRFLQSKKIKLVNINPSDIVEGRPPVVLGLVWTIILHFQIEMSTRALEQLTRSGSLESLESVGRSASPASVTAPTGSPAQQRAAPPPPPPPGARKALLVWARDATKAYGIDIKDFGRSWRDGRAFVAVVHCIEPSAIDVSATERMPTHHRLDTAFKAAENDLGIARLLDPEDVDVSEPDEKSVMTYVAQFLHKYPKPSSLVQSTNGGASGPEQEVIEITVWVIRTIRVIRNMRPPQKGSFERFQSTRTEATERRLRFTQLRPQAGAVTEETWLRAEQDWTTLETLLSEWLTSLDSRLPPPLLGVAEWVNKAETVLQKAEDPPVSSRRTSQLVTVILEEHTVLVESPTAPGGRHSPHVHAARPLLVQH